MEITLSYTGDLRDRCKDYRQRYNLTQDDLAKKLGVDQTSVSNFEGGGMLREAPLNKLVQLLSDDFELFASNLRAFARIIETPAMPKRVRGDVINMFIEEMIASRGSF